MRIWISFVTKCHCYIITVLSVRQIKSIKLCMPQINMYVSIPLLYLSHEKGKLWKWVLKSVHQAWSTSHYMMATSISLSQKVYDLIDKNASSKLTEHRVIVDQEIAWSINQRSLVCIFLKNRRGVTEDCLNHTIIIAST